MVKTKIPINTKTEKQKLTRSYSAVDAGHYKMKLVINSILNPNFHLQEHTVI